MAAISPNGLIRTKSPATCLPWWLANWSRASSASPRAQAKTTCCRCMCAAGDLDKTEHAMNSLMHSVAWDEARFGLPLDLERFMIVATSDFNMGAMENKGLNIFNTKYVLANQATATDVDYANIESVVGHEYFHNWTGNRVTCRDWFQLSLKEGLTVFRDQEFSQDLCPTPSARAVKRIEDVRVLRTAQFPEDAGPMAHPVRPDSYQEINNFYTVTIYEKGAEVVRMMQTLVRPRGLCQGHDRILQAPRRPGRHLRRLCASHRRRQPATRHSAICCRSSSAGTARPAPRASRRMAYTTPQSAPTPCTCRKPVLPRPASPPKSPSSSRSAWVWSAPTGQDLPLQLAMRRTRCRAQRTFVHDASH